MRSPARTCKPSAPFVGSEPLGVMGLSFLPLSARSIYISTPDAASSIRLPFLSTLPFALSLSSLSPWEDTVGPAHRWSGGIKRAVRASCEAVLRKQMSDG